MSRGPHPSRRRDLVAGALVAGAALAATAALGALLLDVVVQGGPHVDLAFLTEGVRDAGRAGGIAPILVSTLAILAVTLVATLPLGVGAAVHLAEYAPPAARSTRLLRTLLDVLAGVPSIVFGLFGLAFFADALGLGFSVLSGGLTLACMVLPLFVRLVEAGLRAVPDELRDNAAALGISRATTLRTIVLPEALPALGGALVLSLGRALAETAALLFTAGYVTRMPASLFDSGRSLSVHVYDLAMNVPGGDERAYATAFVLVVLVLGLNAAAFALTRRAARGLRAR